MTETERRLVIAVALLALGFGYNWWTIRSSRALVDTYIEDAHGRAAIEACTAALLESHKVRIAGTKRYWKVTGPRMEELSSGSLTFRYVYLSLHISGLSDIADYHGYACKFSIGAIRNKAEVWARYDPLP